MNLSASVASAPVASVGVAAKQAPGSACSIVLGTGLSSMEPGSVHGLQLTVTDMDAARSDLVSRGVAVSEVENLGRPGGPSFEHAYFSDPDGNRWVLQEIRPGADATPEHAVESTQRRWTMSEDPDAPAAPDQRLRALDPLVGRWTIAGDAEGETVYEWMDGRFFLMQRGHLARAGTTHSFIEIIGFERGFGATETPPDITSRVYTTTGDTLVYTYEADEETVTIWGGAKGSPAAFRGTWSDSRTVLRGAWNGRAAATPPS